MLPRGRRKEWIGWIDAQVDEQSTDIHELCFPFLDRCKVSATDGCTHLLERHSQKGCRHLERKQGRQIAEPQIRTPVRSAHLAAPPTPMSWLLPSLISQIGHIGPVRVRA